MTDSSHVSELPAALLPVKLPAFPHDLSDPTSQEPRPGPLQLVLAENLHTREDLPTRKSKLNKLRQKKKKKKCIDSLNFGKNYDQELKNPIRTVLPALAPAVLPVFSLQTSSLHVAGNTATTISRLNLQP